MIVNPATATVAQLREQIAELDPTRPTSKLRKAELITLLRDLAPAEPQVYQGAMHETAADVAAVDQVITDELADTYVPTTADLAHVARTARQAADALHAVSPAMRTAAKALAQVAWGHQRATVRSMGRTVHGKVVDTVLRAPGPDGMGRVCVVVAHDGHPTRRTLHRYVDVQFSPLAS